MPKESEDAGLVSNKPNREWKILVIDDNPTCLMILEKMLRICNYKVTTCRTAKEAISIIQVHRICFDIVIIDLFVPDIDEGFEFLKRVHKQTYVPVIIMSSSNDEDVIKKSFQNGAFDYMVKPIRIENVRYLWINVYKAQRHALIEKDERRGSSSENYEIKECNYSNNNQNITSNNKSTSATSTKAEDQRFEEKRKSNHNDLGDQELNGYAATTKKQRVIWTPELHDKFVAAINQFANSKPVPKKILEIMNVPGLTRENVASHLQKYRQHHKRLEQSLHQQSNNVMSMMVAKEKTISPMNAHNFQSEVISKSASLQVRSFLNSQHEQMLGIHQPQPIEHMTHGAYNVAHANHPCATLTYPADSRIQLVDSSWSTYYQDEVASNMPAGILTSNTAYGLYGHRDLRIGYHDGALSCVAHSNNKEYTMDQLK